MSPRSPVPGQAVTFSLTVRQRRAVHRVDGDRHRPARTPPCRAPPPPPPPAPAPWATATPCPAPSGSVAQGRTVTVTVSATLQSAYTGSLSNTAAVGSATADPTAGQQHRDGQRPDAPHRRRVRHEVRQPRRPRARAAGDLHPPGTQRRAVDGRWPSRSRTLSTGPHRCHGHGRPRYLHRPHRPPRVLPAGRPRAVGHRDGDGDRRPRADGNRDARQHGQRVTSTADSDTSNDTSTVSAVAAPSADVSVTKSMIADRARCPAGASATPSSSPTPGRRARPAWWSPTWSPGPVGRDRHVDNGAPAPSVDRQSADVPARATSRPADTVTVTRTATLDAGFEGTAEQHRHGSRRRPPDPDPSDNTATVTGTAAPSADVSVVKSLAPPTRCPASPVTFTLAVRNDGPSTAAAVTLADTSTPRSPARRAHAPAPVHVHRRRGGCPELRPRLPAARGQHHRHRLGGSGLRLHRNLVEHRHGPVAHERPRPLRQHLDRGGRGGPVRRPVTLTKAVTPSRPVPGEPVTFLLSVRNSGPSDATAVTVTDQLDAGLGSATASGPGATCSVGTDNLVTCALGTIAPGASTTVTVTATLSSGATGDLTNTAEVSSATDDPNPANNTATATATTVPAADLSITKTMSPVTPVPGRPVTFTLTVRNNGPSDAAGATVTDALDPALSGAVAADHVGQLRRGRRHRDLRPGRRGRGRRPCHRHRHRRPRRRLRRRAHQHRHGGRHDARPQPEQQLRHGDGRQCRRRRRLHHQDRVTRRPRARCPRHVLAHGDQRGSVDRRAGARRRPSRPGHHRSDRHRRQRQPLHRHRRSRHAAPSVPSPVVPRSR